MNTYTMIYRVDKGPQPRFFKLYGLTLVQIERFIPLVDELGHTITSVQIERQGS